VLAAAGAQLVLQRGLSGCLGGCPALEPRAWSSRSPTGQRATQRPSSRVAFTVPWWPRARGERAMVSTSAEESVGFRQV